MLELDTVVLLVHQRQVLLIALLHVLTVRIVMMELFRFVVPFQLNNAPTKLLRLLGSVFLIDPL